MKTQLTLQQAIAEGFEYAARQPIQEYQCLNDITHLTDEDFENGTCWTLAAKEGKSPTISAKDIAEMIAENMESDHGNDTGDDTEDVYRIVSNLDFEPTANMINEALKAKVYRKLTDIELIK